MRLLASANVLLLLAACGRGDDDGTRVSSVDQLAAASPDSAMKQRWRDAAEKGQIPSLDSLPTVRNRLTTRTRAQVTDSVRPPARPNIQPGVVATVRAFSTRPVELYSGQFTVTSANNVSIVGTLPGRSEPFELHYKLPDTTQLVQPSPNTQHQLRVRDEVDNQSVRREFILSTNDRVPVIAYISDGGARPYSRRFAELPLSITQIAPGADSVARVAVTLGGATATLRPGERGRLTLGGAPIGVFVESSYWTPSDRVETAQGDAYHVTLMLYRVRTAGGQPGD